jgi:HSP20 family molecular chaperone IbpA
MFSICNTISISSIDIKVAHNQKYIKIRRKQEAPPKDQSLAPTESNNGSMELQNRFSKTMHPER